MNFNFTLGIKALLTIELLGTLLRWFTSYLDGTI